MTRTIRLRPWQKAAFDAFVAADAPDFLAVATPGAGKTTFALAAARYELGRRPTRLIVVAPTAHLKLQWANAAHGVGLHLDPAWSPAERPGQRPPRRRDDVPAGGLGSTGAARPGGRRVRHPRRDPPRRRRAGVGRLDPRRVRRRRPSALAVGHAVPLRHLADPVRRLRARRGPARLRRTATATPSSDGRVVRPVYFPRVGGDMEWVAPDGQEIAASFDDALDAARSAQRLRTALSLDGQWLPTVLRSAHERLHRDPQRRQPDAGGLVIATDQDHARGIAEMIRVAASASSAVVVTSDDPTASARIARFAAGTRPVARRRADGQRGRRHPAPARRRLRHDHDDRAVLPPGRRPLRALAPGRPPPEGVPLHPRRRPPAGPGLPDRRRAPPQPAPRGP